jgi:hypothetical protein
MMKDNSFFDDKKFSAKIIKNDHDLYHSLNPSPPTLSLSQNTPNETKRNKNNHQKQVEV